MKKIIMTLTILGCIVGCVDIPDDHHTNTQDTTVTPIVTATGTTAKFIKSRSSGTPKVGEWNINYSKVLAAAKADGKPIIICWSNGDMCGYCVAVEKCMMDSNFVNWMNTSDCYFVFQYSGDADKGKTLHDLIYRGTLRYYPGFRIMKYNSNKLVIDQSVEGNILRSNKTGANGAKAIIVNLNKILGK